MDHIQEYVTMAITFEPIFFFGSKKVAMVMYLFALASPQESMALSEVLICTLYHVIDNASLSSAHKDIVCE